MAQRRRAEEGQEVGCCLWPERRLPTPRTRGHSGSKGQATDPAEPIREGVTARGLDILGGFLEEAEVGAGSTVSR